jgi:hypothetical protein
VQLLHIAGAKFEGSVRSWVSHWEPVDDRRASRPQQGPTDLAVFGLLIAVFWLVTVASLTINYLSPVLSSAIISIIKLIAQEETSRVLFVSQSGYIPPLWERSIEIGAVALILIALPFGLWRVYRRLGAHPLFILLGGLAVSYLVLLSFRLTSAGWETATRGTSYAFVGLSFVLALAFAEVFVPRKITGVGRAVLALCVCILFIGGFLSGWQPNVRLANPYLVDAGDHAVVPQGFAVAEWMGAKLGPGNNVAADRANGGVLLADGGQVTVGDPDINQLLNIAGYDSNQLDIIKRDGIQYIVMDNRTVSRDGMAGYYFIRAGGGSLLRTDFLDPGIVGKFDELRSVNRILDAGNIVVYDVRALLNDAPAP